MALLATVDVGNASPVVTIPCQTAEIKLWLREIKEQELAIAHARRNALNPEHQIALSCYLRVL
jgi:hypothetical protein